ncbi:glycosyltransferase [Phytoactinopolyspora halotolerans]|uniref:Glycosyltransferase family 4 protein n=1 Tax=Phytoactinopolyspora halotolerans TaxID=1981512 RepID=A0A6L9SER6_9ACTN|nr:glycosyltransferase [Phytoactinopolyspora halotolerans]NEE03915.1 glycosyltransferase family 4 protein [Phytoactinopolyspora halotolerans]
MSNRIIYVAPDFPQPIGGVRASYRHVELLTKAGYDAAVWHCGAQVSLEWFGASAPVLRGMSLSLDRTDLLVLPEAFVFEGVDPAPGCRKAIYNQNHFLTFVSVSPDRYPRWTPRPAVWVSSLMIRHVVGRLQPALDFASIHDLPYVIDLQLFRPAETRRAKIAWMPRKRPNEAALIHGLLLADSRFDGVTLSPIEGLNEVQTASELGTTSVFIGLSREEGFGLPIAEALAAGCVVVGYPSGGGVELFDAPGTLALPDSDVLTLVDQVAEIVADPPAEQDRFKSRAWVEQHYSESRLLDRLIGAIDAARDMPGDAGDAIHPWPQFQRIHGLTGQTAAS